MNGCSVEVVEKLDGVCWANWEISSTEIPIWAIWDWGAICPKGWLLSKNRRDFVQF